ncbi:hypothetical protein Ahy_A03g012363 [Arachis hypogaea]|uniref:Uncharacterized protein n=1 Tax=Arachis hypogaea TaxID=3818 RepID=A0A445DT65_ARAHY|nr:hypothetical protein Ahy_A03g012363 [Arachis hypogaea]
MFQEFILERRRVHVDENHLHYIEKEKPMNNGKLLVHAEECVGSETTVEMIFRCSDLENRDLFSKRSFFDNIKSCGRWYPLPIFQFVKQKNGFDSPEHLDY